MEQTFSKKIILWTTLLTSVSRKLISAFLMILMSCSSAIFYSTASSLLFLETSSTIYSKWSIITFAVIYISNIITLQTWQKRPKCDLEVPTPHNFNLVEAPQDISQSYWNFYTIFLIYRDNFPPLLHLNLRQFFFLPLQSLHPSVHVCFDAKYWT